jgi:hypothetical protein
MNKYEVIEASGDWIVRQAGVELARFEQQRFALSDVARRLADADVGEAGASFALRYQARAGGRAGNGR